MIAAVSVTSQYQYPAAFLTAMNALLSDEGGYVNNPSDPGGETKFGISKRSYPHLDISTLTRDAAIAIYFRDFWDRYRFAELPDPIAIKIFNLSVNLGPAPAFQILQRAQRACGHRVADDGVLGQLTIDVAHSLNLRDEGFAVMAAIRSEAASLYRRLAMQNYRNQTFIKGWLDRAYE